MILLTILVILLLFAIAWILLSVGIGGIVFLFAYGDIIVCVGLLILIIRHFMKKK